MVKILVVEDDVLYRDAILTMLESAGFGTLSAPDGRVGMELALEQQPDLILADIAMPDVDGFRMIEELRRQAETATIPVIFVTAKADLMTMRTGMLLGADDYLAKPFERQQLLAAIQTRLDKQNAIVAKYTASLRILRKNILNSLPHELRTPLQQIMGYAELLHVDYENVSPDEVLQASDSIIRASKRLHRLIENYLTFTRIEALISDPSRFAGQGQQNARDAAEIIVREAGDKARAYKRQDDLDLQLASYTLPVANDDLGKIVEELVDNAFKFSQQGSPVQVNSALKSEHFVITVADEGRGMSIDQMTDMGAYMQFERAHYEQQGVGLGYSIAQGLVELYGGEIQVNSRPQQGTRVAVRFPVATPGDECCRGDEAAGI